MKYLWADFSDNQLFSFLNRWNKIWVLNWALCSIKNDIWAHKSFKTQWHKHILLKFSKFESRPSKDMPTLPFTHTHTCWHSVWPESPVQRQEVGRCLLQSSSFFSLSDFLHLFSHFFSLFSALHLICCFTSCVSVCQTFSFSLSLSLSLSLFLFYSPLLLFVCAASKEVGEGVEREKRWCVCRVSHSCSVDCLLAHTHTHTHTHTNAHNIDIDAAK